MAITPDDIMRYCFDNFEGLVEVNSWGERGVFYNPGGVLETWRVCPDNQRKGWRQ